MTMRYAIFLVLLTVGVSLQSPAGAQSNDDLARQVRESERAFARSMATRDFKAFSALVSDEAVFFGRQGAARGRAAVLAAWQPFFAGPAAPFSWEPDEVEVLASGTLAMSSGPVKDPSGKQTGVFNSIWRREGGGWKVIFDKGCPVCDCPTGP